MTGLVLEQAMKSNRAFGCLWMLPLLGAVPAVFVARAAAGEKAEEFLPLKSPATAVAFSADGRSLAAGTSDGSLHLWENPFRAGKAISWRPHTSRVSAVCFAL